MKTTSWWIGCRRPWDETTIEKHWSMIWVLSYSRSQKPQWGNSKHIALMQHLWVSKTLLKRAGTLSRDQRTYQESLDFWQASFVYREPPAMSSAGLWLTIAHTCSRHMQTEIGARIPQQTGRPHALWTTNKLASPDHTEFAVSLRWIHVVSCISYLNIC